MIAYPYRPRPVIKDGLVSIWGNESEERQALLWKWYNSEPLDAVQLSSIQEDICAADWRISQQTRIHMRTLTLFHGGSFYRITNEELDQWYGYNLVPSKTDPSLLVKEEDGLIVAQLL